MKFLRLFLLFTMLAFSVGAFGQIQVGTGTSTQSNLPINTNWGYNYSEQIYLQTEINGSGNITSVSFYFASGSGASSTDWTIFMGHTTKSTFTSTTDWVKSTGMTQVFTGSVTFPATGNWMTITLNTPFAYNNLDNLVIGVDENTANYASTAASWRSSTLANSGIYYRDDSNNPNPASPPAGTRTGNRANVILGGITVSTPPNCTTLSNPSNAATNVSVATNLSWTAATGVPTGYKIDLGTTAGGTNILNDFDAGLVTTYDLPTDLAYNTTYYAKIKPYNVNGSAAGCTETTFTTNTGCVTPTTPSNNATNAVPNQLISWSSITGATGYIVNIGTTAGGTDVLNAHNNGTATSYAASGLSYSTQYYVSIKAYNVNGTTSAACNTYNFTTMTDPTLNPPFTQNFATYLPTNWREAKGALAAPSTLTGTSSEWLADGFANVGTTGAARINIWGTSANDWLISPPVNLGTGTPDYQLEFDLALTIFDATGTPQTNGTDDVFAVVISMDNGATWTSANTLRRWDNAGSPFVYNNISNAGEHIVLDLSTYSGIVQFGFYGFSNTSNADNDLFVDNVKVGEIPNCPIPTGLTANNITAAAANLNWTENGTATTWEIEWGATGFTQGTGTAVAGVTTKPYNLSGLTANTTYQYYVRADCSGDYSAWAGPFTFKTLCVAVSSFSENFDGVTTPNLPSCWSRILDNGTHFSASVTTTTTNNSAPNGVNMSNSSSPASANIILVSPVLSNLSAGTHRLRFYARNSVATQDLQVGTVTNPADGTTFTTLQSVDINTTFAEYVVSFAGYTGSDTYIAIRRLSTTSSSTVHLDNIIWEEIPAIIPACSAITTPTNTSTNVSVATNINWVANIDATGYKLSIGTTAGGTDILNASDLGNVTSYNPPVDLSFNTTYYVTLTPYNATGDAEACTEISFTTNTGCVTPSSPTNGSTTVILSPTISWSAITGATGYIVNIGTTAGGTDILNAHDNGSSLSYAVSGLSYATPYHVSIKAYNANGTTSAACNTYNFTTIPDPTLNPPFTQNFATYLPTNWRAAKGALAAPSTLTGTSSSWLADGFANVGTTGAAGINIYGSSVNDWLISPPVNLGPAGGTFYQLEFDLALTIFNATGAAQTNGTDDVFAVVISMDNGATWTSANTLRRWDNAGSPFVYNNISTTGQHIILDLSAYSGIVQFGFYAFSNTSNADNDLFVDNVEVREILSNDAIITAFTGGVASNCPTNNATFSVTIRNGGSNNIAIGNASVAISGSATSSAFSNTVELLPGGTEVISVTGVDLSAIQMYNLTATVTLAGDANATNNTANLTVGTGVTTPFSCNFTGFTGANLSTVFPLFREATGATTPSGTTSDWISSSSLGTTTAKVNLFTNTRNEWIITPNFLCGANTGFDMEIAITNFANGNADPQGMQGTDDAVYIKVSADCGATWTTVATFNASNTTAITNVLTKIAPIDLSAYSGQLIQVGIHAKDGPISDSPDYDFHIKNLRIDVMSALPVELSSFTAEVAGAANLLQWETASEENNSHFEIERSIDGKTFERIGEVQGNGTTFEVSNYEFIDQNPTTLSYYRLKQVDFNGKFEHSNIVVVSRNRLSNDAATFYPIPVKQNLTIDFNAATSGDVNLTVIDLMGRQVITTSVSALKGENQFNLDFSDLPSGSYFVRLQSNEGSIVKNIIKQ